MDQYHQRNNTSASLIFQNFFVGFGYEVLVFSEHLHHLWYKLGSLLTELWYSSIDKVNLCCAEVQDHAMHGVPFKRHAITISSALASALHNDIYHQILIPWFLRYFLATFKDECLIPKFCFNLSVDIDKYCCAIFDIIWILAMAFTIVLSFFFPSAKRKRLTSSHFFEWLNIITRPCSWTHFQLGRYSMYGDLDERSATVATTSWWHVIYLAHAVQR